MSLNPPSHLGRLRAHRFPQWRNMSSEEVRCDGSTPYGGGGAVPAHAPYGGGGAVPAHTAGPLVTWCAVGLLSDGRGGETVTETLGV